MFNLNNSTKVLIFEYQSSCFMKHLLSVLAFLGILLCSSCEKKPEEIPVESVTLSQATAEMFIGETAQLKATVLPSNASDKTVTWASSKQSVATVSDNGLVTALAEGTSTITASAGAKSATCTIQVSKKIVEVTSIELDKTELELIIGESVTLIATVKPDDATNKTISWSSTNEQIAKVDPLGKVTAEGGGEATIIAKAGEKQATCKITVSVPVESISLDSSNITLEEGQSVTLVATVKPDDATDKKVTWSCSDSVIAIVDQTGKVTAVKEGSATIIAQAGDKQATCEVTIRKKVIAVESITLDHSTLTLNEGQSATLIATVKPDNATNKTVTWSSSADEVAKVDQDGKVSAIKVGSATITAKAGEKQATCQVTVQEWPKVSSITFNSESFNGYIGTDYSVSITISPNNAQYDLDWTVSDTRVASIQGSGTSAKIHTNDYGVAEIIVKDKISGKTASITVSTVVNDFTWKENTGETYSGYPLITIEEGGEHQLKFSCTPSSATKIFSDLSQFVFYEPYVVSSPTCITISEDGLVHGVKEGIVGIKPTGRVIRSSSGAERVYIKVKPATVPVTGISLNKTSLTLKEGESETLTATISPSNASNKTVSWSSNKTGIAIVDQSGKVTAVSAGSAIITASAGNVSATCTVTVQQNVIAVTSVALNKTSLSLNVGESETLVATVKPDNATDKTVTWVSSNTTVATVTNGIVTAKNEGIATITATAGGKSTICTVTVTQPSSSGPEAVDLGLPSGIKWASFNLGASKPEEYGDYYAWGETEPKEDYSWSTYKWGTSETSLTKYNTNISRGTVDNKTVLEPEDDVAHVKLGGKWRMPTDAEWTELRTKCTWTWVTNYNGSGINGRLVKATNGNSIFLPAAYYRSGTNLFGAGSNGFYWSSSLYTDLPYFAGGVYFDSDFVSRLDGLRYNGLSVRPVYGDLIPVSSVSLSQTSVSLIVGGSVDLTATVSPSNASNKTVTWSSSNTSVATVSNGTVTAKATGTATITVTTADGGKTATCSVTVNQSSSNVPEAVDLGLPSGIKWASFNLGASKPEEYGDYYAWGETEPKEVFSWETYKWYNVSLTKYNSMSSLYGTVDNRTGLELSDDVAHVKFGGEWRIPTKDEWTELFTKCTWTWITQNGVNGEKVTGPNGNSIFLPAAGYRFDSTLLNPGFFGLYLSSSLYLDNPFYAWSVYFDAGSVYWHSDDGRQSGQSVRPVSD